MIPESSCLPAVLRSHFAGVRVQNAIATAGRLGTTPARFATVSCGLAVLLIRAHDALTAEEKRVKIVLRPSSVPRRTWASKLPFPQSDTRHGGIS